MKRVIKLGIAMALILPSFAIPLVLAETTTTTTTNADTTTKPLTAEEKQALAARIKERKTALKIKLTTTEKTRIVAKCSASQGVVGNVKGKLQSTENARIKAYTTIKNNLTELSTKLKDKGVNTTGLEAALTTLQTKIDTFNTDLAKYKQAISDLKEVDCKADPDGFKASLETARTALQTVNTDGVAIRTYLTDTLKPLLKTIRTQLEPLTTTSGGTN